MSEVQLKSVRDIATTFGVSRFGLYRKIRAGEIPAYHFGRKVLLDPAELREALRRPQIAAASSISSPPNPIGSVTTRKKSNEPFCAIQLHPKEA